MAIFKRRSPARLKDRSSAAAPHEPPGTPQQYERPDVAAQHERPGTPQQYERPGAAAQHERPGTPQQYERPGAAPQYERPGTAYQAAETPRSATRAGRGLPGRWPAELILGLATVVLGLIVVTHPMHSLTVLAILLGVLMVVSGVFHAARSLRRTGDHRMWGGIAGVLFFLTGIFLLRHVSITLAIIGLFAGFTFIIAGVAALAEAMGGQGRMGRAWSALFGIICLFAGIAAITTPIHSLARLAIVLGWAFFAMGILHMVGAFVSRRTLREQSRAGQVSVPGQRAAEPTGVEGAYGAAPATHAAAPSAPPGHRPPQQ
jgi:uncharacterized membrane protein HdeD (DUF308 family)